jgi:hypothetical protein
MMGLSNQQDYRLSQCLAHINDECIPLHQASLRTHGDVTQNKWREKHILDKK